MDSPADPTLATPQRLKWRWDDIVCADGHRVHATFSCSVAAVDDPVEKKMLREVFGQHPTSPRIVDHFNSALRTAAGDFAKSHNGDELLTDELRPKFADTILAAAKRVAFACGVDIVAPIRLDLVSPTLEQTRFDEMQRTLHGKRTDEQIQQFKRAGELLQQFREMRQSSPDVSPAELMRQLSPADQPVLMKLLQMAGAKERPTTAVWAVAGDDLFRITLSGAPKVERIELSARIAPLRSIATQDDSLILGGRTGVTIVDANSPGQSTTFTVPDLASPFGFSRALQWKGSLWACHRDCGIVAWQNDRPDSPHQFGNGARLLCELDNERLIFAAGRQIQSIDADGHISPVCDLTADPRAIFPLSDAIVIIQDDGIVREVDRATLASRRQSRPTGKITAAATLPWMGGHRLLLATDEGPIVCVSLDDSIVTRYSSVHTALSSVAAAGDLVAAVSSDRQRLILWNSWDGAHPIAEIHVAAVAKHRVADITLV